MDNTSPFPALSEGQGVWVGTDILPAWTGIQSRQGSYTSLSNDALSDGTVSIKFPLRRPDETVPTLTTEPTLITAYAHLKANDLDVAEAVLTAIAIDYSKARALHVKRQPSLSADLPDIQSLDALRLHVGLGIVHLIPIAKDGVAYIGLEFGCSWDEEHGVGVLIHGARVIAVGSADASFDEQRCLDDGGDSLITGTDGR